MNERPGDECPSARREGACGHEQRLVGDRSKQVLTLLGKVTLRRPYYQCIMVLSSRNKVCKYPSLGQINGIGQRSQKLLQRVD